MANERHVAMLLHDGVASWNTWRQAEPEIRPDLSEANLERANLSEANLRGAYLEMANLRGANLSEANLQGANFERAYLDRADFSGAHLNGADLIEAYLFRANLIKANLSKANLFRADLSEANLSGATLIKTYLERANLERACLIGANLSKAYLIGANLERAYLLKADLREANFSEANLSGADLDRANLSGADLSKANLSGADLDRANLSDCTIYGIAAWDVHLDGATQTNLRITPSKEAAITVDNLEVAQFLYLLIHNQKIRAVLDTITSKVVLILGRFGGRKPNLDMLREALRNHPNGYIPVLFDFNPQAEKPVFETVKILANLARFVVADLTDPNMVRSELSYITANVPTVPIQSLLEEGTSLPTEYSTWEKYRSFLPVYCYVDFDQLLANLTESVIEPVERHVQARRVSDDHGS